MRGKTTITNLINRFYDIADGKIRYDGININKIKKVRSAPLFGHCSAGHEFVYRHRYGQYPLRRLDATDEDCRAAARLSGADDFISRLPEGYDTMLTNNGANLSQGQRQLIAIARAAVADPPVMILDEATSSIDTRTEAIVQRGMDKLMEGRTVFVIAHRLSTVMNSDVIMVLDHGRIIERGTHDELIANTAFTISSIPARSSLNKTIPPRGSAPRGIVFSARVGNGYTRGWARHPAVETA